MALCVAFPNRYINVIDSKLPKKALKIVVTCKFYLSFVVTHVPLSTVRAFKSFGVVIKLREARMHNHSIIFLFLVFRDTIVANKAAKPSFSPLYL